MITKRLISFFIFISFSIFSYGVKITWLDEDGYPIKDPEKNGDVEYWSNAMDNVMIDSVIRCLPKNWKKTLDDFKSNRDIFIKIGDKDLDELEESLQQGEENVCICGGHDGQLVIFLRPKSTDEKKACCYCPEATILHELIHLATGVKDNDDYPIDNCVYSALKNAGIANCVNKLPPPKCKCKDEDGHKPPSDCDW